MNYDIRLQRRVDWVVWATALAFAAFAMHEVRGATPVPPAPATPPVASTAEESHRRECGDCHLAYPARLLPASTWRQVMTGLDRHFGVDASLDPATAEVITRWLEQGAAPPATMTAARTIPGARRGDDAALRITTTPWFVREHREVPAATWRRAAIGSAANCAACHTDAGRGRFSERALRIPN